MRTQEGIPLGQHDFLGLSSERAEMTSLEEITILGINKWEDGGAGGIDPESFNVELETKV